MAERSETVSFRLPASLAGQLRELATQAGESPGEHARRLVSDAITNRHHEEITEVKETLQKLREDMATAVVALLIRAGKAENHEAEEWVKRNLRV